MKTNQAQKQIPKDWREVKLGDIGVFSKGAGIRKNEVTKTGHNAVRYGEIYSKYDFHINQVRSHIPDEVLPTTRQIEYGDILFAASGETIDEIGKSAAYLLNEPCYAGGDIIVFRPKNSDSLFLSYFLNIGEARKKLRVLGQGQSVVHIYKSDLEDVVLHIPPLPEQKRIVKVLETWDRAIALLERKIALKREVKKGLMQQLLTGKRRLPGFSGEWKEFLISEIGTLSKGGGFLKKDLVEMGRNAVRYGELYTLHHYIVKKVHSFIPDEAAENSKEIKRGDILMAASGETIDEIGKSAAYLIEEPAYAGGDIIVLSPEGHDSRFLGYFLNTGEARRKLRVIGEGQSVIHIYKSDLQKLKLTLPEHDEQTAIGDLLFAADTDIASLQQKLTLLKDQKKYLLNNLVTGAIRTPEDI